MYHEGTFIYFIQPEGGGLIKIGRANDPEARLRMLQVGCPVPLRLCRAVEGTRGDETRMHQVFAALRVRGEWFKPHPVLANVADAIPDESLGAEPLDHAGVPTSEPLAVITRWERLCAPDYEPEPPQDPLERRLRYERHHPLYGGELPLTAIPEDMAPEDEWRQSSAEAA